MSYYQQGLAVRPRNLPSPYVVGAIFDLKWPGQIREEYGKVNLEFLALQRELIRQVPHLTPEQNAWITATWQPFSSEWFKTYAEHGEKSGIKNWIANPGYGDWENAQAWKAKLRAVWDSARAVGFELTGPAPTPPTLGPFETLIDGLKSVIKYIIIAVVVGVGGYYLYQRLTTR